MIIFWKCRRILITFCVNERYSKHIKRANLISRPYSSALLHSATSFRASLSDPSLFTFTSSTCLLYVLVYVDDIIVTGSSNDAISELLTTLAASYPVKDLGPLHYFLGVEVVSHPNGLLLSLYGMVKVFRVVRHTVLLHVCISQIRKHEGPAFRSTALPCELYGAEKCGNGTLDVTDVVRVLGADQLSVCEVVEVVR